MSQSLAEEFKEGIEGQLEYYGRTGYILQNIGLAVQAAGADEPERERLWRLLDEVTLRIREAVDNWMSSMQQ